MHSGDEQSEERGRGAPLLFVLLCMAAVLRLWSLDFGLPHTLARPDETEIVTRSVRFFATDLDPRFFHYPSLYFYLIGAVYAVWAGGLALLGQSLTDTLAAAALDLSPWIVMARAVSAVAGVGTVAAVYALGSFLAGARVGLAAALFLTVAPLHVRDSHFATTDVVLTLLVTLAGLFVLRSYRSGAARDYALAGLFSGLAMSTKYVGLLMPAAITAAYLLSIDVKRYPTPIDRARAIARDTRPWIFTAAMAVAFLATTPYAVLHSDLFFRHFLFQFDHLGGGHGLDLGIGGVYHLRYTLPLGVGWPAFVLALVGVALALGARWREALVLLAFPLAFYAATFSSQTVFLRYMMPVIPFVCLFAGYAAVRIAERLPPARQLAALGVLLVLATVEPLARDVTIARLLGRTDSRVLATDWLVASVDPGTHSIYQTGEEWGHLELPRPVAYYDERVGHLSVRAISPAAQRVRDYRRFQAEVRRDAAATRPVGFVYADTTKMLAGAEPDYIVHLESDLPRYAAVLPEVRATLDGGYEPVHVVEGASAGEDGWYDQLDAFYLPFVGFEGVPRPGPRVTIFRRRPAEPRSTTDERPHHGGAPGP